MISLFASFNSIRIAGILGYQIVPSPKNTASLTSTEPLDTELFNGK